VPAIETARARHSELLAVRAEADSLSEALVARKAIERAKGLLMTKQGLSEPEAFRWVQRTAMDRRTTMKAVAQAVIENLG
jgi:two-component system, response regulator PdtaR